MRIRRQIIVTFLGLGILSLATVHANVETIATNSQDDTAQIFAYDNSTVPELREESRREENGVIIRDVSFPAYKAGERRVSAYLVQPADDNVKKNSRAGILFFHWLGEPKGDREEFLDEAVALARHGAVSLLIQGHFPWKEPFKEINADRKHIIEQTIEARRALDLLIAQPGVDAKRIGYVGHDYGAMYGALVAGVDKRPKIFIFVAGMGNFGDWSLKYWPRTAANGEAAYRQQMKSLDPENYLARAKPAALFFQFADTDKYISRPTALAFADAASQPKQVQWYAAAHDMNIAAARDDRRAWLMTQLKLRRAK